MSNCQDIPLKKKRKKVTFSACGIDEKKECAIHALDASKMM